MTHEAEVAGVGAVGGAVGVVAVEGVAGDVGEVLDTVCEKLFVGFFQRRVIGGVVGAAGGEDPVVGVATVFDEDDWRVGTGGAELFDKGNALGCHGGGVHVGQAVDDVNRGIELDEVIADFFVHRAVSGEAEVDDGAVEPAAEDRSMDHAGAACAGPVGDAGAVEDDGLFFAWCEALEVSACGDADFEELDAVVERQVGGEFAFAGGNVFDDEGIHLLGIGFGHVDPFPFAVSVAGIEIDAADSGGGHVSHGKVFVGDAVIDVKRGGVGFESSHHAGAVATESPDGFTDVILG